MSARMLFTQKMGKFFIRGGFILCVLLHLTHAGVSFFNESHNDSDEVEKLMKPAFIACSLEQAYLEGKKVEDELMTNEFVNFFGGGDSVWHVFKFPNSSSNPMDYEKCEMCSIHFIDCVNDGNLEKIGECKRRSIYNGKPYHGACEKHVVNLKGKAKIGPLIEANGFHVIRTDAIMRKAVKRDINQPASENLGEGEVVVDSSNDIHPSELISATQQKEALSKTLEDPYALYLPIGEVVVDSSNDTHLSELISATQQKEALGKTLEYPYALYLPIGWYRNKTRRVQRETGRCGLPSFLTTAEITCRVHPSFIKCVQRCSFGYTLEEGIERKMECLKKEGVWKPSGFQECRPFVDCTVTLISGGSLACTALSVSENPECSVECTHYEDKEALPAETHVCSINGIWDPPLPFCASPGTGLTLEKAPMIKLHGDLQEK